MDIITIDFETFYDTDFSLSKITTEEYVRSPQFEVIGVAVKVNNGPTEWASGTHEQIGAWLQTFNWADSMVLAHNTMFDGAILGWRFGIHPRVYLDTLCMGRAIHGVEVGGSLKALAERYRLGEKGTEVLNAKGKHRVDFTEWELDRYGDYCVNDVELTYKLFARMVRGFPKQELRIIDLTLRMFIEPRLELDVPLLEQHLKQVRAKKEDLLATCGADKAELMSNDKFAELLRGLAVEPPKKISPATGRETYAFAKNDEAFKALLEHPDVRVQALVGARLGTKSTLEETRTQRFIDIASRGNLPVPIRYYAAHTGRFGGDDKINLQNLPSRGANANALKKAIVAPEGYKIIDADSAQIEARVLAWLAGQDDLVEAFAAGKDVYKKMASAIYGKSEDAISKDERFIGKTTVLGAGYGMGAQKFQAQLKSFGVDVDLDEARRIIDIYRRTNDCISGLWKEAQRALECMQRQDPAPLGRPGVLEVVPDQTAIRLPSGLLLRYDDLRFETTEKGSEYHYRTRKGRTRIYGGKCLAADTEVLTERGWVRITDVTLSDRVWDGVEWVKHDGLMYQGEKATIVLDGVGMTADHQVLTEEGWRDASSCEGLHRAGFWMPDGSEVCGDKRATLDVGVSLPLREGNHAGGDRCGEVRQAWWQPLLRLCSWGETKDSRHVAAPGVLGMAFDAGSMPVAYAPFVEELRGARDNRVPGVGHIVRRVLAGHGGGVPAGADARPNRQRWGVLPGELPMGSRSGAGSESSGVATRGSSESASTDGYFSIDASVSLAPRAVYDIRNAGPRSRFVVRGVSGPFIVHNCVENVCQAIARCIIAEQMLRIGKRYKVVLTVHDAIAIVCRDAVVDEAKAYVEECMRWVPDWATGLPLNCEAGAGQSYGDC